MAALCSSCRLISPKLHPLSAWSARFGLPGAKMGRSTSSKASDTRLHEAAGERIRIGYCTDTEGNLDYFCRLVESPGSVLRWQDPSTRTELELADDGCYFVHGGDAVDKGPGDVRLCRMFVSLKRRHPERVFLLVGNRDLNKLRYSAELAGCDLLRPIDVIPRIHWDPEAKTLREHLEALSRETGRPVEELNTRAERLR